MRRLRFIPLILAVVLAQVASAQSYWWQAEYAHLLRSLSSAPGKQLQTSFDVRDGKQVNLELRQLANQSVLLVFDAPGESVLHQDSAGNWVRGTGRNFIFVTDTDRNGTPDIFTSGPSRDNQSSPERISVSDHQAIVVTWGIGIGYAVNWFLHKVSSATPRR